MPWATNSRMSVLTLFSWICQESRISTSFEKELLYIKAGSNVCIEKDRSSCHFQACCRECSHIVIYCIRFCPTYGLSYNTFKMGEKATWFYWTSLANHPSYKRNLSRYSNGRIVQANFLFPRILCNFVGQTAEKYAKQRCMTTLIDTFGTARSHTMSICYEVICECFILSWARACLWKEHSNNKWRIQCNFSHFKETEQFHCFTSLLSNGVIIYNILNK